mmetsp:Transcript_21402/g.27668  ORF Transcript_21402/g.27668 Transcript_21402/m.27668 type:complete len:326 (+) Transcript_21402:242-1219(+)|eukprot:CAMPEP_0198154236 /NCGR_PEP_ID=MMETSP1443-20131203/67820_1 /TAXON_ID=186043 /ORGANISM="Entomoneis sp., Strain CCMP2396" /LENGTH=325 /DNA_ID=CAMNT_0043820869 /DNA_START=218 /DNA_END=1195 /DNA_ORIENTATION=+
MPSKAEVLKQAEEYIPATVRMISGCRDEQTSADVSNVASFSLPDPAGQAGGACTSALLQILYADHKAPDEDLSFQDVLLKMRGVLSNKNFEQIPQLSSSRPLDIHAPFTIVPAENAGGTRRAVVIAINYGGQQGELRGCHNDAKNMIEYIKDIHGFKSENITILMDDGEHTPPTRDNILAAYRTIVEESQPGDCVFTHYSGHGGKLRDDDGDEKDGFDETLVPVDYATKGQIRDDDIFSILVGPMARGVVMTCLMDCCHSGTVLDLPFEFVADGEQQEMHVKPGFDPQTLINLFGTFQAMSQGNCSPLSIMEQVGQLGKLGCQIL